MKPLTIRAKTLAKIGLGALLIELSADIGKVTMLRAVKKLNSETANKVMDAMDYGINCGEIHGLKKCRLKLIRGMCKACIDD